MDAGNYKAVRPKQVGSDTVELDTLKQDGKGGVTPARENLDPDVMDPPEEASTPAGATPGNVNVTIPDEDTEENKDNIELLGSGADTNVVLEEVEDRSLFFDDGVRRIDFVVVYTEDDDPQEEAKFKQMRELFQHNLQKEGLQLEISEKEYEKDEKTVYVKVHATWEVLSRFAEIINMKMPLAKNDMAFEDKSCMSRCLHPFDYNEDILPEIPDYFTAPFSRARADQFLIGNKDTVFTTAQRSLLTHQILSRAVFEDVGNRAKNKFGIKKMLSNGAYVAAYPLHPGDYYDETNGKNGKFSQSPANYRRLLFETWARPGAWYKFQPLDHIRLYFGEKIGIYFTWIGYYTAMLIPAALVGLIVFIIGGVLFASNTVSVEICEGGIAANFIMCPLCDARCSYWKLSRSCMYSKVTYLFDNEATVFFAAFMALWATFFHEMWKRKEAEIEYDWDVADFEEEETVRPEFEATVRKRRMNPINKEEEPYMSFSSRVMRSFSSIWAVVFMLCIVIAAVFGVIIYRMSVSAMLYAVNDETIKERATTITSVTAACINLVAIIVLGKLYLFIAQALTNFETHRTLTEWEDSFTLKMFLFQFVNHYASLFYIGFIKGKFVGRPGSYNRKLGGSRQEECDPAGCSIELCIQLAIIMIGKQAFNNFMEVIFPKLMNWFRARKMKEAEEKNKDKVSRWEKDYTMSTMPNLGLFDEYLEMVIQFGFVSIFVSAFPLAPLFALLNNIIEVRLDAYKFVTQWRRPLALRAQDIGIWFGILQGVSKIAVITNAFIIAFTAEFIPKLVYKYSYSQDENLTGFVNFTLSTFNVADFESESVPDDPKTDIFGNVTQCRYRGYRENPMGNDEYEHTITYWHIQTARLAFLIAFIFAVQSLSWLIMYMVPDVPKNVKLQMLREKYLAREAVMTANRVEPKSPANGKDSHHKAAA